MDTAQILRQLQRQRKQIDNAIAAMEALNGITAPARKAGRPKASVSAGTSFDVAELSKPAKGKRKMSAEGRKRIAEAARKRWAKIRAAKKA